MDTLRDARRRPHRGRHGKLSRSADRAEERSHRPRGDDLLRQSAAKLGIKKQGCRVVLKASATLVQWPGTHAESRLQNHRPRGHPAEVLTMAKGFDVRRPSRGTAEEAVASGFSRGGNKNGRARFSFKPERSPFRRPSKIQITEKMPSEVFSRPRFLRSATAPHWPATRLSTPKASLLYGFSARRGSHAHVIRVGQESPRFLMAREEVNERLLERQDNASMK